MEKYQIKHRYTGAVLFEYEPLPGQGSGMVARHALEAAVKVGANLVGANLVGAYLVNANLVGANLGGAYLGGANLGDAYLVGANLVGANLGGAYLGGANLGDANLVGAYLGGANLGGANLGGAYLGDANLGEKIKLIGARPLLLIGPIGSRADTLHIYLTDAGMHIRAGCFFGTREKFVDALDAEHGENNHGIEYRAALVLADAHAALWTPKEVAATTEAEVSAA